MFKIIEDCSPQFVGVYWADAQPLEFFYVAFERWRQELPLT